MGPAKGQRSKNTRDEFIHRDIEEIFVRWRDFRHFDSPVFF